MEELLDPILLAHGVHVGDLVLGDGGEVQVHLQHKGFLCIVYRRLNLSGVRYAAEYIHRGV